MTPNKDSLLGTRRSGTAVDAVIRILVLAVVAAALMRATGLLSYRGDITPANIQHLGTHAYSVEIPKSRWFWSFYSAGDRLDSPTNSPLVLSENGKPFGRPHSLHQAINDDGAGRYSHWGGWLRFSTPDNSDPRTNGRRYSYTLQPDPLRLFVLPVVLIVLLVAYRQRRGLTDGIPEMRHAHGLITRLGGPRVVVFARARRRPALYGLSCTIAAYYIGIYAFGFPSLPVIAPDSTTYWSAAPIVPLGYTLFVHAIYGSFGTLHAIVVVQAILFAAAAISVQTAVERVTRSPLLGAIVAVATMAFGAAPTSAITLLSESTFTSLILFHIAAAGWFFSAATRRNMVLLALTAMLAISIRPAGYFLAGGIFLLFVFCPVRRPQYVKWCIVPFFVFMIGLTAISTTAPRSGAGGGNFGANLFPHIASIYRYDSKSVPPQIQEKLRQTSLSTYQKAWAVAPGWRERQALEQNNFNKVLFETKNALQATDRSVSIDDTLLHLALDTLSQHPFGYLQIVSENMAVWYDRLLFMNVPALGALLRQDYVYQAEPTQRFLTSFGIPQTTLDTTSLLLDETNGPMLPLKYPDGLTPFLKAFYLVSVTITVLVLVARFSTNLSNYVAYVAALAFGAALLVSLSTVFIPRYAIPIDPIVAIVDIVAAWMLLSYGRRFLR